jgi:VanZ family protein
VLCWLVVIAIESAFLSAARTGSIVDPILHAILPWFNMQQIEFIHEVGRKVGHFLGYGIMGYLLFRALRGTYHVKAGTEELLRRKDATAGRQFFAQLWRWKWFLLAIFGTFLVATADEVHQMGDPTRTGSWWDVALDTVGATIIQLVVLAVIRARSIGKQPTTQTPDAISE